MNRRTLCLAIAASILLIACSSENQTTADRRIAVSGAWALYPLMTRWAEEYRRRNPDIVITISAGGAGKGVTDALTGTVDLGMVSRDINPVEVRRGAWWITVVRDAVIPTISADNPHRTLLLKRGISREECRRVWITGTLTAWKALAPDAGDEPLRAYTRADACGAAETWARYLGGVQEELKGLGVYGDPGLIEALRKDALGLGFNNVNFAYDPATKKPVKGIIPLPLDVNGDGSIGAGENHYGSRDELTAAIAAGRYPSPPARDLHLVSQGPPARAAVARFITWILTEGQTLVDDAGYIRLSPKRIETERAKLAPSGAKG